MAAPMKDTTSSKLANCTSSERSKPGSCHSCEQDKNVQDNVDSRKCESRQLLYPDTFGNCYKEEKLQIIGKKKCPPNQKVTQKVSQSAVLSQLKAFLPELSKANKSMADDLKNRPELAESVNIESVDDDNSQHIEMNLSLVPSAVLVSDSSENSSDDSSSDDDLDQDGTDKGCDNSRSGKTRSDQDRLRLPGSSKKSGEKTGKALIEEIVKEDECDEDFTNR